MQLVIYKQDNGIPAILVPTEEALQNHTLLEIAIKDVPAGKPFRIVEEEELPIDFPQEVWEVLDEDLNSGIGGVSNVFNN